MEKKKAGINQRRLYNEMQPSAFRAYREPWRVVGPLYSYTGNARQRQTFYHPVKKKKVINWLNITLVSTVFDCKGNIGSK